MDKKLATTVVVYDADNKRHEFLPGETPPAWAEKVITNLKAWADDETEVQEETADEQGEKPADSSARRSARRSRG